MYIMLTRNWRHRSFVVIAKRITVFLGSTCRTAEHYRTDEQ